MQVGPDPLVPHLHQWQLILITSTRHRFGVGGKGIKLGQLSLGHSFSPWWSDRKQLMFARQTTAILVRIAECMHVVMWAWLISEALVAVSQQRCLAHPHVLTSFNGLNVITFIP